ncbi:hypothetical protein [Streptomyces sp. UNOB3_S3]|uniref:hypothetical protein n=1 Tax=Streptomyces sp. UNOB3_S3 TaxID=2871682 RepID=UPI001E3D490B|nr:hypothetical protein [Streptomyces sp. UNOB3_S3]MCC3773935.1 hypothetical protein [Streptomyces sp. UNOB3_S3]
MKLRHVRATAVFGIAVVALTGARGHHGASCGGGSSHHSSGSSTSGGTSGGTSTSGGFSSGGTTGGGTTTGGATTGGATTGGGAGDSSSSSSSSGGSSVLGSNGSGRGGGSDAMSDIKIMDCAYTDRLGITAKLSATNGSATLKYTYRLTVKFTDPEGKITTRFPSIPYVMPGKTGTLDVSTPYVPKAGSPSSGGRCEVTNVTRSIER